MALITAIALAPAMPAVAQQSQASQIAANALPALVSVWALDGQGRAFSQGSGFFVSEDGLFVTNHHVVAGSTDALVVTAAGDTAAQVMVVTLDPRRDLALLKVPRPSGPFLRIASGPSPQIGDPIYSLGAPMGLEGTLSDGLVSAIRDFDGVEHLQITAPISPGSSGGPVIGARGDVVGVIVSSFETGQSLNFAVAARYVSGLLAMGDRPVPFAQSDLGSAREPEPFYLDEPPANLAAHFVFQTGDTTGTGRFGGSLIMPYFIGQRMIVYWYDPPVAEGAEPTWWESPWTVTSSAVIEAHFGGVAYEGLFNVDGGFSLLPVERTEEESQADQLEFLPASGRGLSGIVGPFQLVGHSGTDEWTGYAGFLPAYTIADGGYSGMLTAWFENDTGEALEFATLADLASDGRLTFDPAPPRSDWAAFGGVIRSGRIDLTLYRKADGAAGRMREFQFVGQVFR